MTTKKEKGFTIIELLVVVAIIAVLAAIVLVNVTQYINKGKDAAIKGNLSTILTNAAVHYDDKGNFTNFLTSTLYTNPEAAAIAAGATVSENSTATAWCSCATLKATTNTYCVDATGYKKETATACATRCPVAAACVD